MTNDPAAGGRRGIAVFALVVTAAALVVALMVRVLNLAVGMAQTEPAG